MKLLVDTHLLLWRLTGAKISRAAYDAMDADIATVHVSAASIWEVAIKWALRSGRKDDMPMSGTAFHFELQAAGLSPIAITPQHCAAIDDLPLHHRDPFDRMLVAQANLEGMRLLTHDRALAAYGDTVLVV